MAISIRSLDYVEIPVLLDTYILSGSASGNVALDKMDGTRIGIFGQDTWTFQTLSEAGQPLDKCSPLTEIATEINATALQMLQADICTRKKVPAVAEVWVKRNTEGKIMNLLTVLHANRKKDHIEGWNGMSNNHSESNIVAIPTVDFCDTRDFNPWQFDPRLQILSDVFRWTMANRTKFYI